MWVWWMWAFAFRLAGSEFAWFGGLVWGFGVGFIILVFVSIGTGFENMEAQCFREFANAFVYYLGQSRVLLKISFMLGQ